MQQLFQTISFACPPSLEALPGHKLTHRCLTKNNGLNFKLRCNLWDSFFLGFDHRKKSICQNYTKRPSKSKKRMFIVFWNHESSPTSKRTTSNAFFFLSLYLVFPYGVVLKIGVKPFKLRLGGILVCLRVPDRVPLPGNIFTHRFVVVFSA